MRPTRSSSFASASASSKAAGRPSPTILSSATSGEKSSARYLTSVTRNGSGAPDGCSSSSAKSIAAPRRTPVAWDRRNMPRAVPGPGRDDLRHVPVRGDDAFVAVGMDDPPGAAPGHVGVDEGDPSDRLHQWLGALDQGVGAGWEVLELLELDHSVLDQQGRTTDALDDRLQRQGRDHLLRGIPSGDLVQGSGVGQLRAQLTRHLTRFRGPVDSRPQSGRSVQLGGDPLETLFVRFGCHGPDSFFPGGC